jgi:hypothetical protein
MPADAEQVDTDYETEVEAEPTGRTAADVERERADDEAAPLDSAYQPKSG